MIIPNLQVFESLYIKPGFMHVCLSVSLLRDKKISGEKDLF